MGNDYVMCHVREWYLGRELRCCACYVVPSIFIPSRKAVPGFGGKCFSQHTRFDCLLPAIITHMFVLVFQ